MAFFPTDCAAWILWREYGGPINVFEASKGMFPMITGREPLFEADLDWLQFEYTSERTGAYVTPASTVIAQSAVAEGNELFLALLAHLRRQYPEVYALAVDTTRSHDRRELLIGDGEELSGGTSSVNSSIKLGAYAGRLDNINLAGITNPSPNLTTVYLDTPLLGTKPELLEYAPSPVRLGKPIGYPPTSIEGKGSRRPLPPPPPPYHTHP